MTMRFILLALMLGSGPTYAQSSTVSTVSGRTAQAVNAIAAAKPANTSASPSAKPVEHMGILYDIYHRRTEEMAAENNMISKDGLKIRSVDDLKILTPKIDTIDIKSLIQNQKKKGGVDGGGGDSIGLEFQLALGDAAGDYAQYSSEPKPDFQWMEVVQYGGTLHIVAVDTLLVNQGRMVIALNDVATKTIRIQRRMWNAIVDVRLKNAISLNMTLLMKKQQAFGIEAIPNNMLVSAGLSGDGLMDGQIHPTAGLERSNFNSIQCLYGFEQQKRFIELWKYDVLSCSEKQTPGLAKLHADRYEEVAERCIEYCKGDASYVQLHDLCEQSAQEYFALLKGFRRLTPACVKQ